MGNSSSNNQCDSNSRHVRNRSNRINSAHAHAVRGADTHQSVPSRSETAAIKRLDETIYSTRRNKLRNFSRRIFKPKSKSNQKPDYVKFPSFIGENKKWVAPEEHETSNRAVEYHLEDLSPCFDRRCQGRRLLATLGDAIDDCTSVCCDLLAVVNPCNSESRDWKLSDSFSVLICAPLTCISTCNHNPQLTKAGVMLQGLESQSIGSGFGLGLGRVASTGSNSKLLKSSLLMSARSFSTELRQSSRSKASSTCELSLGNEENVSVSAAAFSTAQKVAADLPTANTSTHRNGNGNRMGTEQRPENHEYAEVNPFFLRNTDLADSQSHRLAIRERDCQKHLFEQNPLPADESVTIPTPASTPTPTPPHDKRTDKLEVHEYAAWFKETAQIMVQQSSDSSVFSQFLINNLQHFSKSDLRKLKTLNSEMQKQVRSYFNETSKKRQSLCKSLNEAYAKFNDQREGELHQLIVQQRIGQRLLVNEQKTVRKRIDKQLRNHSRRNKTRQSEEERGDLTYDSDDLAGTEIWEYRDRDAISISSNSQCLPCGYGTDSSRRVSTSKIDAAERRIVAQLDALKLDEQREIQQLQSRCLHEKRQLLAEQEQRRFANLECAIRQLSQFEVTEARSLCQRCCELMATRIDMEIDMIKRIRQAKRDALCRRLKSELKLKRGAKDTRRRSGSHSSPVFSLSARRSVLQTQREMQEQHLAELRLYDGNTETLTQDFESATSQKLQNLMDLCELQLSRLRCLDRFKTETLRCQHAERLRLVYARCENERSRQLDYFTKNQSSSPLLFHSQGVNWSNLSWQQSDSKSAKRGGVGS